MAGAGQPRLRGPSDGLQGRDSPAGQARAQAYDLLEVQLQEDCWRCPQGAQPGQHQLVNGCSICTGNPRCDFAGDHGIVELM